MASGGAIIIVIIIILVLIGIGIGLYLYFKNNPTPTVSPTANPTSTPTLTPTPTPEVTFVVSTQKAATTSIGNSNSFALTNQVMDCGPKSVIGGFQLYETDNNAGIYYQYTCNTSDVVGASMTKYTSEENNGDGNIHYLDRLDVNCPTGMAIGKIQLERVGTNQSKNRYAYTCVLVNGLRKCLTGNTEVISTSNGHISSLFNPGLAVKCPAQSVLNQFKLLTQKNNQSVRYEYTCCSIPN
jgi:cytoskeletal protein RodZ